MLASCHPLLVSCHPHSLHELFLVCLGHFAGVGAASASEHLRSELSITPFALLKDARILERS